MSTFELDDMYMWVGGEFVRDPHLRYKGGTVHIHRQIDLDLLNEDFLFEWYAEAGGKKSALNFYYVIAGQSMENGLRSCNGDIGIIDFVCNFKGLGEATIYVDEVDVEPFVAIDTQGNLIFSQSNENMRCEDEGGTKNQENPDGIGASVEKGKTKENTQAETSGTCYLPYYESEGNVGLDDVIHQEHVQIRGRSSEGKSDEEQVRISQHGSVSEEDHISNSEVREQNLESNEHMPEPRQENPDARDEQNTDASEKEVSDDYYDDSSDANYSPEKDDVSDAPSEAYGDVEGSEDDDIFVNRNRGKAGLMKKLRDMKKKRAENARKGKGKNTADEEWCSEENNSDELHSLSNEDDATPKFPMYKESDNMSKFKMTVGLKFPSAQKYREVLRDWCVRQGFEVQFVNNDNGRITVKCKHDCGWRIHASKVQNSKIFQVKTIKGNHTCSRSNKNELASYKYLAGRIEKHIRDDPDIGLVKLKQIIRRKCGLEVNTYKVLRAKKEALAQIRGVDSKEYGLLWDYCETVRECNPGSKLIIRKHPDINPDTFDRMYFSLGALKKAFQSGCRPVIGLDGCFLKTCYGGQILVAVRRDGNDNMLPIAMAVVQAENKDSWSWFIEELLLDIGEGSYTIISDRQKGLLDAVQQLMPQSEHRFCVRHMYQNFKLKYNAPALKELFWKAACTTNKNEHEYFTKKIEEVDPKLTPEYETAAN